MLTIDELKQKIAERVPELDFIDVLEITTEELVEAFLDKVIDNYEKFQDMLE
jgi:anion-transporting  ArsA/GET3 family ATPase